MSEATLLGKYTLPIHIDLVSEESRSKEKRSYAHYLAEHQPLVAAKVAATEWLLRSAGLDLTRRYTSREYLAGVGIQTILITNIFNISNQILGELDTQCVEQLARVEWNAPTTVRQQNVIEALKEPDDSQLKFLDFPASSVLTLKKKWKGFENVFESKPELVVWTDTSCTYPYSLHGKRYAEILNAPVTNVDEYLAGITQWLQREYNYTLVAAAFRARNAIYLAARPGAHELKTARFMPKDHEEAFKLHFTSQGK